jgi:sugar phosphate isomerase/epimerase
MILGISSFSYGWSIGVPSHMPDRPFSAVDLIKRTRDFGLNCLQIGDNLPLHTLADSQRRELKSLLTKYDLRLELGARGLTEKHLREYIEVAVYFNSPLLRFVTDREDYAPTTASIITIMRSALSDLRDAGITLGIENHDRFKAAELSAIMNAVCDPTVGICLDTVNSLGAGEDLERVIGELAPFTVNLHIKDFCITRAPHKMGFVVSGAPAGQGMLDIPQLLHRLSTYGRCESAILEQWVPPGDTLNATIDREAQWASKSIQYLSQLPAFTRSRESAL